MIHLSEKQSIITQAHNDMRNAASAMDAEGFAAAKAAYDAAEQMEEKYLCLLCGDEELDPKDAIILPVLGVKSMRTWNRCTECELRVNSPEEDHCSICGESQSSCEAYQNQIDIENLRHPFTACPGELEEAYENYWIHQATCRGKAEDTNIRSIAICKECNVNGLAVRIEDYINMR
jgi:hypothetical protein